MIHQKKWISTKPPFFGRKTKKHAHLTATKKTFKRLRSKKNTCANLVFLYQKIAPTIQVGNHFWVEKKKDPTLSIHYPTNQPKVGR